MTNLQGRCNQKFLFPWNLILFSICIYYNLQFPHPIEQSWYNPEAPQPTQVETWF